MRIKPRASKLTQKDMFNSKFFVEDFLDDINASSLLEDSFS